MFDRTEPAPFHQVPRSRPLTGNDSLRVSKRRHPLQTLRVVDACHAVAIPEVQGRKLGHYRDASTCRAELGICDAVVEHDGQLMRNSGRGCGLVDLELVYVQRGSMGEEEDCAIRTEAETVRIV